MAFCIVALVGYPAFSEDGARNILEKGLLGAGAGAAGSAAGGGDAGTGALVGAGVNIVGDALVDSLSGQKVDSVSRVRRLTPEQAYSRGYNEGYNNGFKEGYTSGYQEGVKE
ncbi:MAG: hypothetical protein GF408_00895 [Candidatus Omnitrophica bacterium]|nr:hypothetical protein [Candidatus Omnitrophota bacterium]